MEAAAYSAFDGVVVEDVEALRPSGPGLAEWLRERGVTDVDVCGIATDYCVRATALDAVRSGFAVRLLPDLCAAVAPESGEAALAEVQAAGVHVA